MPLPDPTTKSAWQRVAEGDAPTTNRSSKLKTALSRAKTRAAALPSPIGATEKGRIPAPVSDANDSMHSTRQTIREIGNSPAPPTPTSSHYDSFLPHPAGRTSSPTRKVHIDDEDSRTPRRKVTWGDGVEKMESVLDADAARVAGVWQTDGSQHTGTRRVKAGDRDIPTVQVLPREGRRTLKVLYLFSGVERRASIAEHLKELCEKGGLGMDFFDVDIHVGGSAHDLLDEDVQEEYIAKIHDGEYDFVILSPPCGSWSRANWANNKGPAPCRDRFHPWGFANQKDGQQGRTDRGNQFVHFSIRAIQTAQLAKAKGFHVRCLLEHPEDLGRVGPQALHQGVPASIWQIDELRKAFGVNESTTVAGWQCQFPDTDYPKPTRLYSDIPGIASFGRVGWPILDANHQPRGPLPRYCGHNHKAKTIGVDEATGGFHISPTAAYPEGMCAWIAKLIFDDFQRAPVRPRGRGRDRDCSEPRPSLLQHRPVPQARRNGSLGVWRLRARHLVQA